MLFPEFFAGDQWNGTSMWVGLINWTYTLDEFGWPILVGECLWKPVGPMSFGFSGVVAPVLKYNVNGLGCKTQHCRPGVLYGHCRAGYLSSARKCCHFKTFTLWFSPRVEWTHWFDLTKKHQLVQLLQFQFFCCYSDPWIFRPFNRGFCLGLWCEQCLSRWVEETPHSGDAYRGTTWLGLEILGQIQLPWGNIFDTIFTSNRSWFEMVSSL